MKKKIIAFFKKNPGRGLKSRDIAKMLKITEEHEYVSLKSFLHSLIDEEFLMKSGKRYMLKQIPKSYKITGILQKTNSFYFLKPDDRELHRDIYISKNKLHGAKTGDKVVVGNIKWESPDLNPEGEIIELIGKSGTRDTEIIALAHEFNLPYRFSDKTLKEAEQISEEISPEDLNDRIDFREKTVFTIDPVDAKDFDDALSIELLENDNYSVGVHI